jgi:hypothetical protein
LLHHGTFVIGASAVLGPKSALPAYRASYFEAVTTCAGAGLHLARPFASVSDEQRLVAPT